MYDEVDKFHNNQDKALLGSASDSESSEEVCLKTLCWKNVFFLVFPLKITSFLSYVVFNLCSTVILLI